MLAATEEHGKCLLTEQVLLFLRPCSAIVPGMLKDAIDTAGLADAMTRVFTDDALAGDLTIRGLSRAKLFSWETTGRAVQAALHEAAG